MSKIFCVRLDRSTDEKLARLADLSHRTRGNVLRWLIHNADPEQGLIGLAVNDPQHTECEEGSLLSPDEVIGMRRE